MSASAGEPRTLYRRPSEWETLVLLRLLEPAFPGRDALLAQTTRLKVRRIDVNGSLRLSPAEGSKAAVEKRIPTEAEGTDVDGMTIHILLHVPGGMLHELEVYKDDSSRVLTMPAPDQLRVFTLPP